LRSLDKIRFPQDLFPPAIILEITTENKSSKILPLGRYIRSVEGYVKLWLVKFCKHERKQLKNKSFEELISMMEQILTEKEVEYEVYKISETANIRNYRNKVFHEMEVPSENTMSKIKEDCFGFVEHIESLKVSD
jgi:hypothetical protein